MQLRLMEGTAQELHSLTSMLFFMHCTVLPEWLLSAELLECFSKVIVNCRMDKAHATPLLYLLPCEPRLYHLLRKKKMAEVEGL